jgi:hypothetical protein
MYKLDQRVATASPEADVVLSRAATRLKEREEKGNPTRGVTYGASPPEQLGLSMYNPTQSLNFDCLLGAVSIISVSPALRSEKSLSVTLSKLQPIE